MEEHREYGQAGPGSLAGCPPRKPLRISDLLYAVRKRAVLIAVCAALGLGVEIALGAVAHLQGRAVKRYAITSAIAVTSQDQNGLFTAQSTNPNPSDIYLAENMVDSVIYVMKSDQTLDAAIRRLGLEGIGTQDLYNNLNMSQYNGTQIIEMTLYWDSEQEGVEILSAIHAVSADILVRTLKIGSVSVINQPAVQSVIGGPINVIRACYLVALGALLGIGCGILELLLRPTLLQPGDMERYFGLEVLGEIPHRPSRDGNPVPEALDHYVSLAHILRSRLSKMDHPCVCVTSAVRDEGRTTVCAYLAVQLAKLGLKVLVVDLDTQNPKLGGLFLNKVEYAHSINALYQGDAAIQDAVTCLTAKLELLPAVPGQVPLPCDEALLKLVSDRKGHYDVVLLDTAPVGVAADTMSLNSLADAALLVVRFDGAGMESIRRAVVRLEKSGMRIMGCVVNGVKNLRKL